ncbi:carbonic anhydrase [Acidocella aminolytica]|uniref:Carbonic anhydrase n=1 Tax=Acidocella aminolytica 101 = DSM 11237 TaxID=1120923 RepID=A0A0D6PA99_9PROT|nr:carbonic anhydrase [Acidocella aminolytica]GAN78665.1 carbonic anhydrase [Acidocella aminolytica 101 = DSM 11237]GBQ36687.1 carbonic anhydrase [Acidocella aminolytica 101 = DSM 11237]SHE44813.1 carbonic anhydrase [Acidocella aminolytica 101 = DSM 11237]
MKTLLEGYERFRNSYWQEHKDRYSSLARDGQRPPAMVIACADSRVAPEMIFDCAPGEIFVVRNVSALVPPYAPDDKQHGTSAALEFAVNELNVRSIVVLGHSRCGGIQALMKGPGSGTHDFVDSWMEIAKTARQRVCDAPNAAETDFAAQCEACEHEAVRVSLSNLLTFPWIQERVMDGRLTLAGLHFNVETGHLQMV